MRPTNKLTRFELQIMDRIWDRGEVSVREIVEGLERESRPAYTTVQTIVQRLEQKGAVRRTRRVGTAFLFSAVITKRSAYRRLVDDLLDLMGGPQPLLAHLLDAHKVTLEDLHAAEAGLDDRRGGGSSEGKGPRRRRERT